MRWSANHCKIQKTAHKGLICSLQSNPAPGIVYGQRVNCFELPAVVVLCFTARENGKFSYVQTVISYKEQKFSECNGKQNYGIKNEKTL